MLDPMSLQLIVLGITDQRLRRFLASDAGQRARALLGGTARWGRGRGLCHGLRCPVFLRR